MLLVPLDKKKAYREYRLGVYVDYVLVAIEIISQRRIEKHMNGYAVYVLDALKS